MTDLQHEVFSRHLNSTFRISWGDSDAVEAQLNEVSELMLSPRQERFALVFRGPREPILSQGSYNFAHDEMGEFSLFIVPLREDETGTFYEAVFNRMRKTDQ
jgi:hypothetical protein